MSEQTVFVRGTRNLKPIEIKNHFLIFGPVASVKLPYKRDFGFVKFTTSDAAKLACSEKFHYIEGRIKKVKVSFSKLKSRIQILLFVRSSASRIMVKLKLASYPFWLTTIQMLSTFLTSLNLTTIFMNLTPKSPVLPCLAWRLSKSLKRILTIT